MPQNKNVCQQVWHCSIHDTAVENSELYYYNTEGDRNSVVSEVLVSMDVTRLEQCAYIKIAVLRGINTRECHSDNF